MPLVFRTLVSTEIGFGFVARVCEISRCSVNLAAYEYMPVLPGFSYETRRL